MSFFNELGKKQLSTTAKIATEAKFKIEIAENRERIKELYEELGRKVYENHIREENINIDTVIEEECSKIDKLSKKIEVARKEILALNNKKMCKKCFAEIEKESVFCSQCGAKQRKEKTVLEQAEEKLEQADISLKNEKEAEIVKEELKQKNTKN